MSAEQQKHWVYRKGNQKKLWTVLYAILLLAMLPEPFIHHHPHFPEQGVWLDTFFGFYAWYGFITCALMVVGAKLLGFVLKRKDNYYDD